MPVGGHTYGGPTSATRRRARPARPCGSCAPSRTRAPARARPRPGHRPRPGPRPPTRCRSPATARTHHPTPPQRLVSGSGCRAPARRWGLGGGRRLGRRRLGRLRRALGRLPALLHRALRLLVPFVVRVRDQRLGPRALQRRIPAPRAAGLVLEDVRNRGLGPRAVDTGCHHLRRRTPPTAPPGPARHASPGRGRAARRPQLRRVGGLDRLDHRQRVRARPLTGGADLVRLHRPDTQWVRHGRKPTSAASGASRSGRPSPRRRCGAP